MLKATDWLTKNEAALISQLRKKEFGKAKKLVEDLAAKEQVVAQMMPNPLIV